MKHFGPTTSVFEVTNDKWDPELPAVPAFTEKVLCCGGDSRDASQAGATTVVAMDAVSQGLGTSSAG